MKEIFIPKKIKKKTQLNEYYPEGDLFGEVDRGDFRIGQSYEQTPAKTIVCKICGGHKFIVGSAYCFTAIKCEKCKYEICVHNG